MALSAVAFEVGPGADAPPWALAPSPERAGAIDEGLRLRLADSLAYLADLAGADLGRDALAGLEAKLRAGPVSPWVFCLYSRLVAELAKNGGGAAATFVAIARAGDFPADPGAVPFLDPAVYDSWWDHYRVLLDTDPRRPFKPQACGQAMFSLCRQEIAGALALMQHANPVLHAEVSKLLRMIVLAAPESPDLDHLFNGASTFFLWGATFFNAELRRTPISLVDLLVHESSHVLLFGLAAETALVRNSGDERYSSPLRADPRPIDGIFHACFVATRVHLAMARLLASGALGPEHVEEAEYRRDHNGNAARISLGILNEHARLTELGANVLGSLRAYLERS
jgi:HEXXH motif-containing protein